MRYASAESDAPSVRRFAKPLLVLVCCYIGFRLVRPLVFPLPLDRCTSREWNATSWRDAANARDASAVRGCMVDAMLKRHRLVGWSKDSVVALLGPADTTEYFSVHDLVFWLGPERGFISVDSEWLIITLDPQQRVMSAQIATD